LAGILYLIAGNLDQDQRPRLPHVSFANPYPTSENIRWERAGARQVVIKAQDIDFDTLLERAAEKVRYIRPSTLTLVGEPMQQSTPF
jgi:hypothetical protein